MRWYIIRALLVKEWQRHLANRGGITLGFLLIALAVLLKASAPKGDSSGAGAGMIGGIKTCFLDYDRNSTLVTHLREHRTAEERQQIAFRPLPKADTVGGYIVYPTTTGGLQLRQIRAEDSATGRATIHISVWHPQGNPTALAPYEAWLWREIRRWNIAQAQVRGITPPPEPEFDSENQWLLTEAHKRFQDQVAAAVRNEEPDFDAKVAVFGAPLTVATSSKGQLVPDLEVKREGLGGDVLDLRGVIATGFIVFALYFTCVYLLPTLSCEERERGILLAQALSPASSLELVTAKALFYPVAGITLAALIAVVSQPVIVTRLFFWLSIFAVAGGFLGIGMTIAAIAKTQRAAFLGGMCYLMVVSMLLLISSLNDIPFLPYFAVEFHAPRILHAAINGRVERYHWGNLIGSAVLAVVWLTVAVRMFRRRGWQ
ncbi:MAG: ABC transporter permease [Planctomycetes bacterium]|nr:ABC transporter permease [Planctomycetota bacterium]